MSFLKKIIFFISNFILFFIPKNKFKFLIKFFNHIIGTLNKIYCAETCTGAVKIKEINFKVFIKKFNSQAHLVYKNLKDEKTIYEIAQIVCLKNIYEKEKELIFADIGSFIGYFAFYFARLQNEKNKVYAIESNREHCESIKKGIQLNNFKNIHVFNKILSNKRKELIVAEELTIEAKQFNDFKNNRSNDSSLDNLKLIHESKKFYKDMSITVDELFQYEKPNIIKVDVHGAEGCVLEGSSNILKNDVKYILLELHTDNYLKRYSPGFNKLKIIQNLISSNFSCYIIIDKFKREFNKTSYDEGMLYYDNKTKLDYININSSNINDVMFGRYNEEQFILCIKKDINITDLKCFQN